MSKRYKAPSKKIGFMKIFVVVVLAFLVAGGAAYSHYADSITVRTIKDNFFTPKDVVSADLTIRQNDTMGAVAQQALNLGLIKDRGVFLSALSRTGLDRRVRAGSYTLSSGPASYVVEQLSVVEPKFFSEILIPGTFPEELLSDMADFATVEMALMDDANYPSDMRIILPATAKERSAFLLPETYNLVERTPEEFVKMASSAWWRRFGESIPKDPKEASELSIIASLLQREANFDVEYPTIAGVIYNRLNKKMRLEIDASVVYAWYLEDGNRLNRVLYKHLELQSPFNTYRISRLPPRPICVPSGAAWYGALNPEENPYLYYVADSTGMHIFSRTFQEHQKAIRKVRGN